jgi:hypothetical protein
MEIIIEIGAAVGVIAGCIGVYGAINKKLEEKEKARKQDNVIVFKTLKAII